MNTAQPIYVLSSSKYDASFTGYIDCYEDFLKNISKPLLKSNALYSSIFLVMMIFFLTIFSFIYHKNLFPFPELFISFGVYFITLFSFLKIKAKNYKCIRSFLIKFVLVAIILYFFNRSNFYDIFSDVTLMDVFIPFLAGIATAIYKIAIIRIYDKGLIYLEHLEGIKMFLEGVDDLSQKNFKQAELEKLLPYAIVFGLQNKWSEKMEKYFNFTPPDNDPFTSKRGFSRFSSVLKRVSTPPSKSGRGGGGRSGGGGGGGGGGGF